MHCVFHISIVLLKSGAPVRPCDQRCAIASAMLITRADEPRRKAGGANRDRTDDLLLAKQALSQLSYGPNNMVGLGRVELPTSPLSGVRSNQLSYRPGVRLGRLMQVI